MSTTVWVNGRAVATEFMADEVSTLAGRAVR